MNIIAALLPLAILSVFPAVSSADFYRYYDESGGVNVTNDYKSVPERYRANVTVTTDKQLEKKARARDRQERIENGRIVKGQQLSQSPQQAEPAQSITPEPSPASPSTKKEAALPVTTGTTSWLSRQQPILKVIGVIVLIIAGFVVVGRVVSSLAPRSLAIIIKIAMLAAIAVFLTKGFSEKIAEAFAKIKEGGAVAQKAVDKRSDKIKQQAE